MSFPKDEVLPKLDLLIAMVSRQEKVQAEHSAILRQHTALLERHSALHEQHTTTLDQHTNTLASIGDRLTRIETTLEHYPNPREFFELSGRVDEISRRLPTTLAYAPPAGRATKPGAE